MRRAQSGAPSREAADDAGATSEPASVPLPIVPMVEETTRQFGACPRSVPKVLLHALGGAAGGFA